MNAIRKKQIDVWAGAKETKGYTQKHRPLLWENMLGTVRAVNPEGKEQYFDYDYESAHAYIELNKYTDLRVCRVRYAYQDWPSKGKLALFGVMKA